MKNKHSLSKSSEIEQVPRACSNELAAVEFLEKQRWGKTPCCVRCGSIDVYKMVDAKTGERNSRFLWGCHDCKQPYTRRIGTVYEESRIELRHWCYAFYRACTSKKGVSALEIQRQCQISYKSALFLMNRIRFAMAPDGNAPKLSGTVECDETYIEKKKERKKRERKKGGGKGKSCVCGGGGGGGRFPRRFVADVTGRTIK